jgi:hypothetical protein
MTDPACAREKSKSPDRALACRLADEAGLVPAQIRVVLELFADHLQAYYSDVRAPGVIIHTAVSATEPPGKPIKHCRVVPVRLTFFHEGDRDIQRQEGTVELRMVRLYRFAHEAREQGGLLSQEDLSYLLGVDETTIKDLVRRWRERGQVVPTRGAVKDIGPEPSHKRLIADLLGRGYSTSKVRAMTRHSERSIGRYQRQFGLVLYLLHAFPEASEDALIQLAGLSPAAFQVYREVCRELAQREDCRPHLERLRRLYELDPDGLAAQIPPGKSRPSQATRRLQAQTLDTAIRQTIQEDLGTTRRVAETVADDVGRLIEQSFRLTDGLRPGEAILFVDAHAPALLSGERVPDRPVIPVTVPLATDEVKALWRADEPVGRRRGRIAALIATAAEEQGGVTTVTGLAELLHVAPATLGADLRELAVDLAQTAPIKGFIEDAGPTLTHKDWIVDLDHHGLTGDQITWLTRHAPLSRDRYIETYRRAETLMRLLGAIPQPDHLARVLRLRRPVASQYVDLLERYHGEGDATPARPSTQVAPSPVAD